MLNSLVFLCMIFGKEKSSWLNLAGAVIIGVVVAKLLNNRGKEIEELDERYDGLLRTTTSLQSQIEKLKNEISKLKLHAMIHN
jgi:chaperonin cofactor prefoldin